MLRFLAWYGAGTLILFLVTIIYIATISVIKNIPDEIEDVVVEQLEKTLVSSAMNHIEDPIPAKILYTLCYILSLPITILWIAFSMLKAFDNYEKSEEEST